jgi:hypothetical protein
MDYQGIISDLRHRLEKVSSTIDALENRQRESPRLSDSPKRSTRGRKSMGPEERGQVFERMKRYWAGRRQAKTQ